MNRLLLVGQDERESLKKEILELKRSFGEESYEKEVIQKTASDLRNDVKKLEAEKVENGRVIQELRQRIARTISFLVSFQLCFETHTVRQQTKR